ncbi:MAG TPA: glycosyltransferase family 4 protein [Candidatus Udaeobacter sp.]|jgi:glycosyltransferase involved in cell wall biosynthesis
MRLGYLYSRYPVLSQTFCDAEMLALEQIGFELEIGSVYPPLTSLRHEYVACLRAPIQYAPPQEILKISEKNAKTDGKWPRELVDRHARKYGPSVKAEQRARNALYFADHFKRRGVDHVHVHFANRAAHTAMFLKAISGIPFSITAHGQDFMKDLGNDDLLREICADAEFVAAETDYSRDLLRQRCPDSASKIRRVYNGMDLTRFPASHYEISGDAAPRIISVGRLVAFKGFEFLIDACADLSRRGLDFTCEIIGDGPLRKDLEARIQKLNLSDRVRLLGSLSQAAVLEKLRAADIFALASVTDAQGASDVFPTVIIEAMAAARPVVSTRLAGIPESVVHGETGLLVPPQDTMALADALSRLIEDAKLRLHYGRAGRERIEQHFRIEHTVRPLIELLQTSVRKHGNIDFQSVRPAGLQPAKPRTSENISAGHTRKMPMFQGPTIAYLIDRWPDKHLPFLEREIDEMKRRNLPIIPFVCELDATVRLTQKMEKLSTQLEFLPDAMVIESQWRANPGIAQKLEEERAKAEPRAPGEIFLREARFALALRKPLLEKKVSHVHATTSRALVCALILQEIANVTLSATIERRHELPHNWIASALGKCKGGRLTDRKLLQQCGDSFLFDKATLRSFRTGRGFWQKWSELLERWSRDDRNSTMENQK